MRSAASVFASGVSEVSVRTWSCQASFSATKF